MKTEFQELHLDKVASPLGTMLLVCDVEGRLRALDFDDCEERMHRLLRRHYGERGSRLGDGRAPLGVTHALHAFFAGDLDALTAIEVHTGGTDFQHRVWAELRRIPAGATTTYGQLAGAIGSINGSRAVGLANGSNPIGIVVPCHRVIGSDGTLIGYAGGLERKRWLLDHERNWSARERRSA